MGRRAPARALAFVSCTGALDDGNAQLSNWPTPTQELAFRFQYPVRTSLLCVLQDKLCCTVRDDVLGDILEEVVFQVRHGK